MRKQQFEKLIYNAGLYLVHTSQHTPRFAVVLRNGNKGYQRSIFQFDPVAFHQMTERDAIEHINKCKESMKREVERVEREHEQRSNLEGLHSSL